MSDRPHLRGQTPETLVSLWPDLKIPPLLARRVIAQLVQRDRDDLGRTHNLPKELAREILARGRITRLTIVDRRASDVDRFVKYLFASQDDGKTFEAVRIPLHEPRFSACVSTQVGCALECSFCATGRLGLTRHLEPWEMVEQVLAIRRTSPERPLTGVVFQGQGEPFHNYENVLRAAEVLRHPCGGAIGSDRMTISTSGLLPEIDRYTDEGHPYRLMLSLVSAFSEKRAALMPIGRAYAVEDLAAAMRRHATRRRVPVGLAWVLLGGINDGPEEARELAKLFAGHAVRLSVIDVNDESGRFRPSTDEERTRFFHALSGEGIAFHRRYSGGSDIHAACGMLASRTIGNRVGSG